MIEAKDLALKCVEAMTQPIEKYSAFILVDVPNFGSCIVGNYSSYINSWMRPETLFCQPVNMHSIEWRIAAREVCGLLHAQQKAHRKLIG